MTKHIDLEALKTLLQSDLTVQEIAARFDCSVGCIYGKIKGTYPTAATRQRRAMVQAVDEELVRAADEGLTLQEMGDAIGLTRERIRQRLARVGKRTKKPWRQRALQMYRDGADFQDIVKMSGHQENTVRYFLKGQGCDVSRWFPPQKTKLQGKDEQINTLREQGQPWAEIAYKLGVSPNALYQWRLRHGTVRFRSAHKDKNSARIKKE